MFICHHGYTIQYSSIFFHVHGKETKRAMLKNDMNCIIVLGL